MKKAMLVLVLALGFICLHAQSKTSLGIKAEANMANFLFDRESGLKSDFGFGAGVGFFAKVDLGEYIALQPELSLYWQNFTLKQNGLSNDFQHWGMEVSLYAIGQKPFQNNVRIYAGLGPYWRLGFSAQDKTDKINLYKGDETTAALMQRGDVGAGVVIGIEFPFGMQINASYKYGLLNIMNAPSENSVMSSQVISFGLGYKY